MQLFKIEFLSIKIKHGSVECVYITLSNVYGGWVWVIVTTAGASIRRINNWNRIFRNVRKNNNVQLTENHKLWFGFSVS